MNVIGITGGIGSGKSIISNILRDEGYPVFDCDTEAKNICNSDLDTIRKIKELFGENIYQNNVLDRKAVAEIVFNDKGSLDKLNAIIHPVTMNCMYDFIISASGNGNLLCFIESAIIFESELCKLMDEILTVYAPEEIRINRVIERDNTTKDKVLDRINNQLNEKDRLSMSDYIIHNDRPLTEVKDNLLRLVVDMKENIN